MEGPGQRPTTIQHLVGLDDVPPRKWRWMSARSAFGVAFFALGAVGLLFRGWDADRVIAVCLFGAAVWSKQVVGGAIGAVLNPLMTWRRLKSGAPPEPDEEKEA